MSRDPIYDALKALAKDKFDADRAAFMAQAKLDDDGQWNKHTDYHWSRMVNGCKLDYWPSRRKWQYKGKIKRGDVYAFMRGKLV